MSVLPALEKRKQYKARAIDPSLLTGITGNYLLLLLLLLLLHSCLSLDLTKDSCLLLIFFHILAFFHSSILSFFHSRILNNTIFNQLLITYFVLDRVS